MKAKNIYIATGALAVAGIGVLVFSMNRGSSTESSQLGDAESKKTEAKKLEAVERRTAHAEKLQRKLRTLAGQSADAVRGKAAGADNSQLVMVDVTDIEDSEWVQSMFDSAYVYEGPTSKAELEKLRNEKIGVHTEASLHDKEEQLAQALPYMRDQVEEAREQREAEQKRFEKTGLLPEEKAVRDGVELEH